MSCLLAFSAFSAPLAFTPHEARGRWEAAARHSGARFLHVEHRGCRRMHAPGLVCGSSSLLEAGRNRHHEKNA